jgi:hypothetical protein
MSIHNHFLLCQDEEKVTNNNTNNNNNNIDSASLIFRGMCQLWFSWLSCLWLSLALSEQIASDVIHNWSM